jgi:hypothetical protein
MSDNNLFFNSEEIRDLPLRTEFITGPAGPTGNQGAAGAGVTIGGITGQVLAKRSTANYDTEWVNQSASVAVTWGAITGTLSNQTDLQNVLNAKAPSTGISPSAISGTAVITTDARLSDSRSPNGSATGDLSGTYPAPSVAKLQGYSVSATSPSIGQILQWGGDSWLPAAVPNGGSGGGGLVYFLNFQNTTGISPTTGLPTTPFSPSQLGRAYNIGSGSVTSDPLINGSYSFVCGFVTIVGEPNITTIPAGLWDFNIWADVSSASGNHTQFQFRVFKYNSTTGVYTSLANSDAIFIYEPATIAQYIGNVTMPQTTILATDRIYIEIWAQKNVSGARTVSFYFDSLHPSHIHTTIPSVSGTGVVKVVNGVFQTPANLIFDSDVDAAAAIAQSKIANLTTDLAGKAPSTGISPSAISGTAVITTDARLSDARMPTAHASSHAVGGSDPLTASAIAALGLATEACIIAKSGDDILAKYAAAKLLTPNSAALSSTNRASLIILPASYTLSAQLVVDGEFVDIIGLGAQTQKPAVLFINNTVNVTATDVRISGISVGSQQFNEISAPGQIYENCIGGDNSFSPSADCYGTFINCIGGESSFGGLGIASGTFTNCVGGASSFAGDGGTASGTFINCTSGSNCFGGPEGIASGVFVDCTGEDNCFGGNGAIASGSFEGCIAGVYSFGGNEGTASGTFTNCIAGTYSFGGTEGTASGTFTNCKSEAGGSFGGTDGTASGVFRNCIAGDTSFGLDGGISNGQFYNCQSIVFRSGAVLTAPTSGFAVQQNCSDDLGNIIDGYATS